MSENFQNLLPLDEKLYFRKNDRNDIRLGEIVPQTNYDEANIVILGCVGSDEEINFAPDAIREQFYKLTPFGIKVKVCDLGNLEIVGTQEETHKNLTEIVSKILSDGKKAVVLGGGNDISYPNGKAMAEVFGARDWLAVNIDSSFGAAISDKIESASAFRKILDEKLIRPDYFYEIAFQTHFVSVVHYRYLQNLDVNLSSLEQIRSRETADLELREMMREKFISHSESLSTFFNFSFKAIRSADAPGVRNASPLGLRAGEFIQLVKFAASLRNTKLIQFTELNPEFDENNRTTLLAAIAIHRFCSSQPKT